MNCWRTTWGATLNNLGNTVTMFALGDASGINPIMTALDKKTLGWIFLAGYILKTIGAQWQGMASADHREVKLAIGLNPDGSKPLGEAFKKLPLLLIAPLLFLCGCQMHTLPGGRVIRTDHFPGIGTPSVTVVSIREPGQSNWTSQVVSSPGIIGQAASGVAVVLPIDNDHGGNSSVNVNVPSPVRPPSGRPNGHQLKDSGQRGR